MVDIGGYVSTSLHRRCTPTVILDAGLESRLSWTGAQPGVKRFHPGSCSYDRAEELHQFGKALAAGSTQFVVQSKRHRVRNKNPEATSSIKARAEARHR